MRSSESRLRRRFFPVLLALLCGTGALAQTPDPVTVTVAGISGLSAQLTVTNNSDATVVAFVLGRTFPPPPGKSRGAAAIGVFDSATQPWAPAIPPHRSVTVTFGAQGSPPRVFAALFAEGGTWGDPENVEMLTGRRSGLRKGLEAVIADLKVALANPGMNSDLLISQFESAYRSEGGATRNIEEAATAQSVRGTVISYLRRQYYAGSPITVEGIQKEIDALELQLARLRSSGTQK
jgi:hypothetical protein